MSLELLSNGESFGLILLNLEFICVIGTVLTYLGKWGKRVNFGNGIAEIQQKYEREEEKGGREKMLNFGNVNTEIPVPNSCCSGMKCAWSAQSEKKKKKTLCSQYFYNIFTINHRWLVIISSNLNLILRLLF